MIEDTHWLIANLGIAITIVLIPSRNYSNCNKSSSNIAT